MKKNVLWGMLLFATVLLGFNSCSDDDDDPVNPPVPPSYGAYVLNSGSNTDNTASISYYDVDNKVVVKDTFKLANGKGLGSQAQDMLIYGSKIYISVTNSNIVFVTDKSLKIINTIQEDKLSPRSFETHNGKVYFTSYSGYVMRIDTTSLKIDKRIEVGPYPEMLKYVNSKIYVANSGGLNPEPNNTVSILDTELSTKKDIEVVLNPNELKTDKYNNLYLASWGIWDKTVLSSLQQINTTTDEVTVIDEGRIMSIFPMNDRLYMLDTDWATTPPSTSVIYYDIQNKKIVEQSFVTDNTKMNDIKTVNIEPKSGDLYVSVNNGVNNGDIYIFSADGKFKSKFDTGGIYPMGIWFLNN